MSSGWIPENDYSVNEGGFLVATQIYQSHSSHFVFTNPLYFLKKND